MAVPRQCMHSSRSLINAFDCSATHSLTVPSFLVPAFAQQPHISRFSTTSRCSSKIGSMPLSLPPNVTFNIIEPPAVKAGGKSLRSPTSTTIEIAGPLGTMSMAIPRYMNIEVDDQSRTRTLSIEDTTDRQQRAMWGTVRAYLQNHILGVSEGHAAILRLVGVGYRATIESNATTKSAEYPGQQFVSLKVGYSHPIELGVPKGVKASTPQPTRILLEGPEKEIVKQFAAEIREWRKPEPYKGKGIFVNDETIRLKAKKIK